MPDQPVSADYVARELIRKLAVELDGMNERHGCGQVECAGAYDVLAEARRFLGLRLREPFPNA